MSDKEYLINNKKNLVEISFDISLSIYKDIGSYSITIKLTDDKSSLTNTYICHIKLLEDKIPVLFKEDLMTKLNIPDSCDPFIGITSI
jgi:hypothetical protein